MLENENQLNEMINSNAYDRSKITIEDCIDMKDKYGLGIVLDNGMVIEFTHE